MNQQEIYMSIGMGLLLFLAAVLFVRILQYKRQMRVFAKKLERRVKEHVNQEIHVEYFDRDIRALAQMLNAYSDQIKKENLSLEQEKKRLKNVVAGISHDFRTPLTAAKGYLQLLEKSVHVTGKEREYVEFAIAKIEYLKVLSDAFFEVSSITAKEEEVSREPVDIVRLMQNLTLEQYDWMKDTDITLKASLPEYAACAATNLAMMNRIIGNFFSNARKYAATWIGVTVTQTEEEIRITMENDVEAPDEIDTAHVFDAFYRGASRQKEGAGLGLTVAKTLAEKLGHEIGAECEEGTFRIWLRIAV